MSIKQSKIFNFFQRKPTLSNNSSLANGDDSCNGREKLQNLSTPKASGDINIRTTEESLSTSKQRDTSMTSKRGHEEVEDTFAAEKFVDKDNGNELQETRPPKKRKRIVSFVYEHLR